MAHSLPREAQRIPERVPTPWFVEGPGFRASLVYAYHDEVASGAREARIIDPAFTAWCLTRGGVRVRFEGRRPLSLEPGQWALFPDRTRHQQFSPDTRLISIRFNFRGTLPGLFEKPILPHEDDHPALLAAARDLIDFVETHFVPAPNRNRLPHEMIEPSTLSDVDFSHRLSRWLAVWLEVLSRHLPPHPGEPTDPRIAIARQKLLETPFTEPLPLAQLAAEAGVSLSHFKRLFHAAHASSPRQIRDEARRRRASQFLRETDLPLKYLAHLLGFSSVASFTTWFTRQTGTSPAAFRRSALD